MPARLQLLFPVEAPQLLIVHHHALPVQHDVDPAIAEPPARRCPAASIAWSAG
jgi:hypothetical protein